MDSDLRTEIIVRAGFGRGSTDKSAFDAALMMCGVEQYNLIPLSSVIPMGAGKIRKATGYACPPADRIGNRVGRWGDRLYCVMACETSNQSGMVAAGIGWAQAPDGSGIFVEHHAWTPGYGVVGCIPHAFQRVTDDVYRSIEEMRARRGWTKEHAPADAMTISMDVVPGGGYTCVLVVAMIETAGWTTWQ